MSKISTILCWLCVLAGLALVGWFGNDYVATLRTLGDTKAELASWQDKYNTAVKAQKESEETIAKLQDQHATLMSALDEWREQYAAIDRKNTAAQRRLRSLEAENAEIRDVLRSRVPDDVWRLLFPRQDAAGNAGGDAGGRTGGSGGVGSGVR